MHPILAQLRDGFTSTGDLAHDVAAFLRYHGCPNTATHCGDVAAEARRIARLAGANETQAEHAGWLHDVSAVFPGPERVRIARELGVEVLPEEERYPPIVHQKLSVVLARELFGLADEAVLQAVGCHTTLHAEPTLLDKVLFVADKIAWDQPGVPPYQGDILAALDRSLDDAALCYLAYMWQMREKLKVLHPWLRDAYLAMSTDRRPDHRVP